MQSSINLKFGLLAASGFGILTALMIAAGMNSAEADIETNPPVPVNVQEVRFQSAYNYEQRILARVETVNTSAAGFDTGGLITAVNVEEGEKVQQGAVLAQLDTERLLARKNELLSAIQRATADRDLAVITEKRTQDVVAKGLDTNQALDIAQANLAVTKAALSQARAQLQSVEVDIKRAQIIAPFDATIVQRHVDPGVSVMPGTPVLTLQTDQQLELRASLPASLAQKLKVGDKVKFANQNQEAVLVRFVSAQNIQTRTQDAIFQVDSAQWQGLSGEIINLVVPIAKSHEGVWVPMSALSAGIRGMWSLYVVGQDNKITSRIVELIYTDGEQVYISGALSNAEKIVTEGTQRLVPGQVVSVI